jgi:hypothetical protein
MYLEPKGENTANVARIGWVTFTNTNRSCYYQGRTFRNLRGRFSRANFYDVETEEHYWITGCRKDGSDRLGGGKKPIYIDEDAQEEYWKDIRNMPEKVGTLVRKG